MSLRTGETGQGQPQALVSRKSSREQEGASSPRQGRGGEPPMAWGPGSAAFLARGGMWSCPAAPQAGLAFRSSSEAWLPALGVNVWPQSQHCLPSPSPLTSVSQTRGPTGPLSSCPCLNGAIQGLWDKPIWRALPPPPPGCPWPQPLPVWVGGLAMVRAASSQASITEGWIVDQGHGDVPHVTGLQGTRPTLCAPLAPGPTRGSWASKGPPPEDRAAMPPWGTEGDCQSQSECKLGQAVWD